ncbi:MAG: enoyl-CoA hydratase-related protein [Polyangiaceae bacterium]|nr:enoyl-CoA hydratase-related protein [Polyangiaceae bacterium]
MSDEQPLRVERRGGVALITIDRPDRMNALSRATLLAFEELGRSIFEDRALRAIVLTGAGDRAFSAGADLKERKGMNENAVRELLRLYRRSLLWLERSPVPVVAALNGVAFGGGLELALLCDLRIASAHAKLGLPETTLGIIPALGGTQRLPRVVGEAKAKELILLGRRIEAEEALGLGLVSRVVPSERSLIDDTLEWIRPISEGAPIAQRAALAAIDASYEVPMERGMELELVYYDECLRSADRVEALEAFAEKRRPRFRGE